MTTDLSREQYDALPHLNWSRLKLIERSPAHYVSGYSGDSAAFRLGTAAHSATLEPGQFAADYVVYTEGIRRGKKWDAFEMDAITAGKTVLNQKEHNEATQIANAVRSNPAASRYLSGGAAEQALVWRLGDFDCKGRADYIGDAIVDLKSTGDASPRGFAYSCAKYGYFGQAAWYSDGQFKATGVRKPFVFVAVEKTPPYVVTVFRVPDEVLAAGREQYLTLLGRLDYCKKNNFWGGYSESEVVDLEMPSQFGVDHGE